MRFPSSLIKLTMLSPQYSHRLDSWLLPPSLTHLELSVPSVEVSSHDWLHHLHLPHHVEVLLLDFSTSSTAVELSSYYSVSRPCRPASTSSSSSTPSRLSQLRLPNSLRSLELRSLNESIEAIRW